MDLSDEDRARLPGLGPAEIQEMAIQRLQDDDTQIFALQERILALRNHMRAMRRLYNSGALINARLPVEILVMIFMMAGPWCSPEDAIRLTHVCHAWRTIIEDTPVFWCDFLNPPPPCHKLGLERSSPSIVLDALAMSAPMPVQLALAASFLPVFKTPAAKPHMSRIFALDLEIDPAFSDMDLLCKLRLPLLEELQLDMNCRTLVMSNGKTRPTAAQFPRLRTFATTCPKFSLAWVGPTLIELAINVRGDCDRL